MKPILGGILIVLFLAGCNGSDGTIKKPIPVAPDSAACRPCGARGPVIIVDFPFTDEDIKEEHLCFSRNRGVCWYNCPTPGATVKLECKF